VRSITLDGWEPEQVKIMTELGNEVINSIYEADVSRRVERATPSCARFVTCTKQTFSTSLNLLVSEDPSFILVLLAIDKMDLKEL
jgi:hypothetical protein